MAITAGKFPLVALAAGITLILAGCGLTQKSQTAPLP
jgi:type VI secretion system protein VasD